MALVAPDTINTGFLQLAWHMKHLSEFGGFTLFPVGQSLQEMPRSRPCLALLELKGALDAKVAQVFPSLVTPVSRLLAQLCGPAPPRPVES